MQSISHNIICSGVIMTLCHQNLKVVFRTGAFRTHILIWSGEVTYCHPPLMLSWSLRAACSLRSLRCHLIGCWNERDSSQFLSGSRHSEGMWTCKNTNMHKRVKKTTTKKLMPSLTTTRFFKYKLSHHWFKIFFC